MSTSETVTFECGPCPCGKGQVLKRVTTQDNPWSTAQVSYGMDCSVCSTNWRLERRSLVLRSSETFYESASAAARTAEKQLDQLLRRVLTDYLSGFSAKTMKAEHAELERLGVTHMTYRQFLEHSRQGGDLNSAAFPARNIGWVAKISTDPDILDQLKTLVESYKQAKAASAEAGRKILRRKIE